MPSWSLHSSWEVEDKYTYTYTVKCQIATSAMRIMKLGKRSNKRWSVDEMSGKDIPRIDSEIKRKHQPHRGLGDKHKGRTCSYHCGCSSRCW